MPWTGPDASISWRATVWDPEHDSSSGQTGVSWWWWRRQEDITGRRSNVTGDWFRETRYPPPFSMWWWMRCYKTGFQWWWRARKIGSGADNREEIKITSSTRKTAWSHCRTCNESRDISAPWLACLTGWYWILTSGRQSEWSSTRSRRRGRIWRRRTGEGWREREFRTRGRRGVGFCARSAGRRWRSGQCRDKRIHIMGGQQRVYGVGKPRPPVGSHVPTVWPSQPPG